MEDSADERSTVSKAVDSALTPLRIAVSKPAQRAYLGTFLFAAASLLLIGVSTLAYTLFYYSYVPQVGIERTIHLQFGDGHPSGTALLSTSLTSLQAYDVILQLHLPRTPSNLAAGNFMLDLSLHSSAKSPSSSAAELLPSSLGALNTSASVLARSRRPAIMTYSSPIVNAAHTLSGLPWYLMGWKKESEVLEVSMFEGVEFAKGWRNIPNLLRVEIEAGEKMQFYDVGVKIIAKFSGLRWILYNHRILSYLFFTTTFWTIAMTSTFTAYFVLSSYLSEVSSSTNKVKSEDKDSDPKTPIKTEPSELSDEPFDPFSIEDLSDTSRTFPTMGRQRPLRFSGRKVAEKHEEEERVKEEEIERTTNIQPLVAEADEEDNDGGFVGERWRDSGLGTSLEEGDKRAQVQRRRKALFSAGSRNM